MLFSNSHNQRVMAVLETKFESFTLNHEKMKKQYIQNWVSRLAFSLIVLLSISLSSCKDDETPSPSAKDIATEKLIASTWKMTKVTVDGVDQTSVYKDLTLTFTNTNYSSTNGKVIWPASGSWLFENDLATSIKRNDGLVMSVENLTDTALRLGLDWETTSIGTGRVLSIKGKHVFEFGK